MKIFYCIPKLHLYVIWLGIMLTVNKARDSIPEGFYSYEYYGPILVASMEEYRQFLWAIIATADMFVIGILVCHDKMIQLDRFHSCHSVTVFEEKFALTIAKARR